MDGSANPLKRKRELLPLGTPPTQTIPLPSSSGQRPALRTNRACNTCRRQKMRCDGPDSHPCSRCKNAGLECIFEMVPQNKAQVASTTSRIESLEKIVEDMRLTQCQMHASIQEILHELRRGSVNFSPSVIAAEDQWKPVAPAGTSLSSIGSSGTPGTPFSPAKTAEEGQHFISPTSFAHPSLPPIQSLLTPSATPPDYTLPLSSLPRTSLHPGDGGSHPRASLSDVLPHQVTGKSFAGPSRRPDTWPPQSLPTLKPADYLKSQLTRSGRTENIATPRSATENSDQSGNRILSDRERAAPKTSDQRTVPARQHLDARQVLREDSGNRVWNPDDHIREFRVEDATFPDAITKGLLTETEAQNMFFLFFEHCHPRMPIFDPKTDDFNSLRERSPFCFCCVLMVAMKARDGGNQPSTLQLALWDEAMTRAKESMFHRVKDLEVIQGLLLLSAWSESTGGTSWILAGHAIRCGVELGIHKSLGKLVNRTNNDESVTRLLVCSARVWCALFAFEHQLSLGIGRFTMTGNPKTVNTARETLLRHPLSNPHDMRLVSACEIMAIEYQILESLPSTDTEDPRCQAILEDGRARMDAWHSEWDALLSVRFSREHYMRQTITVQRCYGYVTVHLACMPRNVAAADVHNFSPRERENCFRAVSAARDIVKISVEMQSYRDGLRYSPPCFYSGVSFVGALLLRLGCVLVDNQEYDIALVEELSRVLRDVPTCRFKFSFLTLLKEHQQHARRTGSDLDISSRTEAEVG